jgi:HK97 family phage portal protein
VATRVDVARKLAGSRRARAVSSTSSTYGYGRGSTGGRDITGVVAPFLPGGPPVIPPPRRATERQALGLPPFGRAVALLCNALAGTGWYARRTNPSTGLVERVPEQPGILTDPDPLSTPWHYRWGAGEDLILYGNHFGLMGEMDWRTGRPGWVVPIPAHDVWVITDPARPSWYRWAVGGVTFDADELLHVSAGARSGELLGRGVLEQYGWWLGGVVAAEDYSRDTFAAGALPPAVITSKQVQSQRDADDLKAKWRNLTSTREPVILPDGTELKPVVGNAADQQLVEARTWNAQQVANAVGVPGYKLGLPGATMTYQNIVDADVDWVRDGVDRWAQPLTATITKWLLPAGTEAVWDYAGRARADQRTTQTLLTGYTGAGILTVDEARGVLERPPLPDESEPATPDADELNAGDVDAATAAAELDDALDTAAPAARVPARVPTPPVPGMPNLNTTS